MTVLSLHALFAILLAATVLRPRRRAAVSAATLAAYAIGAGAFAAVPGIVAVGPLAARLAAVGLAPSFVGTNVGLMVLAAVGTMVGGLLALSEGPAWPGRLAGAAAAGAGVVVLAALLPLVRVAGFAAALAAAAVLAVAGLLTMLGRGIASLRRPRGTAPVAGSPLTRVPTGIAVVGGVVALAADNALIVIGAALVTGIAAHVAARGIGRVPAVPVLPLAAAALVPFAWMLATIAGPVGLGTAALPTVPLSPPAQALLAPALVAGAWGFLGVWPLHRWVPGPILAAVGGALLLRVGAPALGGGFAHLQPPLFAIGALAAWHAALTRRPAALIAALGFVATMAIFSGAQVSADARVAAAVLFATATAAAALDGILRLHPHGRHHGPAAFTAGRVIALAAGGAMYTAIGAGLRAEVVLTVVVAGAVAAGAWRERQPADR